MKPRRELSPRQREVLRLAARGLADKEISNELGISDGRVSNHFHEILIRLKARSRLHAYAIFSRQNGG